MRNVIDQLVTPLNVDMLRELRGTLEMLTRQREIDESIAVTTLGSPGGHFEKRVAARDEATDAVIRAIILLLAPADIRKEARS